VSDPATTTTDWEARALTAEARVRELTEERARLWDEVHRLRGERSEEQHYRNVVRYMESTASWRLTWPLREFKRLYVKVRRTLGD
jgi:hypothetical protein